MSTVKIEDAEHITHGYKAIACETKGCINTAWVAPWYVPYGGYCEKCKDERKEEAREEEFQEAKLIEKELREVL